MDPDARLADAGAPVLDHIRASFPIAARPFDVLGHRIGRTEAEVLSAVRSLKATGDLGRLAASFDGARLGYLSTIVGLSIGEDRTLEAAALIAEHPAVTLAYEHEDLYNLWFTVLAPSQARTRAVLDPIAEHLDVHDILEVPAERVFKAAPDVRGLAASVSPSRGRSAEPITFSREEKALARLVQADLPLAEHPFGALASTLEECGYDVDEAWVLDTLAGWQDKQVLQGFRASGRPHLGGASALAIWDVSEADVASAGASLSACEDVTQCYQRPRTLGETAAVCAVVHAASRAELGECVERLQGLAGLSAPRVLHTVREIKRAPMTYFAEAQ